MSKSKFEIEKTLLVVINENGPVAALETQEDLDAWKETHNSRLQVVHVHQLKKVLEVGSQSLDPAIFRPENQNPLEKQTRLEHPEMFKHK